MPMNDYRMNQYNSYPIIIDVPCEETTSLLAKVLGITGGRFLITCLRRSHRARLGNVRGIHRRHRAGLRPSISPARPIPP